MEHINRGENSLASCLACIEESIESEGKQFEEGLNSKVKLDIYKRFGKEVEFKRYLHGVGDAGTSLRLLFKHLCGEVSGAFRKRIAMQSLTSLIV